MQLDEIGSEVIITIDVFGGALGIIQPPWLKTKMCV